MYQKEFQYIYTESFRMLLRDIKEINTGTEYVHTLKIQHCKYVNLLQIDPQIQFNPNQNLRRTVVEIDKLILKFVVKAEAQK